MNENVSIAKCPHCGKSVTWNAESEWKPFCSERCRLIDLGDWLSEKHAIAGNTPAPDQDRGEE
ncbi:MAG: DNA gyrase inhibitor YacG [Gammaproteobacteria bacterium]